MYEKSKDIIRLHQWIHSIHFEKRIESFKFYVISDTSITESELLHAHELYVIMNLLIYVIESLIDLLEFHLFYITYFLDAGSFVRFIQWQISINWFQICFSLRYDHVDGSFTYFIFTVRFSHYETHFDLFKSLQLNPTGSIASISLDAFIPKQSGKEDYGDRFCNVHVNVMNVKNDYVGWIYRPDDWALEMNSSRDFFYFFSLIQCCNFKNFVSYYTHSLNAFRKKNLLIPKCMIATDSR